MSISAEIEKLEAMRKAGTITDEEFAAAKRRVLEDGAGGQGATRRTRSSFSDWRLLTLGAIALAAIGILVWEYVGAEPEPDPMLSLVSLVVVIVCLRLMRPFGGSAFGGDFGDAAETAIPLAAILCIGAAALAGGAFLIGLPLVALGLAAFAVVGFVMWCWSALFGE